MAKETKKVDTQLLAKYVQYIQDREGTTYIDDIGSDGTHYASDVKFTPVEVQILNSLNDGTN